MFAVLAVDSLLHHTRARPALQPPPPGHSSSHGLAHAAGHAQLPHAHPQPHPGLGGAHGGYGLPGPVPFSELVGGGGEGSGSVSVPKHDLQRTELKAGQQRGGVGWRAPPCLCLEQPWALGTTGVYAPPATRVLEARRSCPTAHASPPPPRAHTCTHTHAPPRFTLPPPPPPYPPRAHTYARTHAAPLFALQPPFVVRLWLMSLFEPGSRRATASLQEHLAQHPQVRWYEAI